MTEPSFEDNQAPRPRPSPKGPRNARRVVTRWLKRGLLVAFALGGTVAIVLALLPKPVPVDVATVAKGPMTVTVDEDGQARVKDRYVVSAPLTGRIDRIELDPGDEVKEGAILARIVPMAPPLLDERTKSAAEARVAASSAAKRQTAAQVERAAALQAQAKKEADRARTLAEQGALSQAALEQALLSERSATADAESARFAQRVADYEVLMAQATIGHLGKRKGESEELAVPAPVTGRVLAVLSKSEGAVQPGTPLVELGDPAALELVVDVLTSDAVLIRPGAVVTIDRWGGPPLDARVALVEPSAFSRLSALGVEERRVNVVVEIVAPREKWASLGDGYRIEAHIVVWQDDEAVQVPASAVFRHGDAWAVYRIDGGIARLQPVQIGQRTPRQVQITEGLAAGQRVVLHPSDRVRDGTKVSETP